MRTLESLTTDGKQTAVVDGTINQGALGDIPLIRVSGSKPRLRNNGYACYLGQGKLTIPELYAALPEDRHGCSVRQGHVYLLYDDGQHFLTYAAPMGNHVYSFC